jgi:hypothetical protein
MTTLTGIEAHRRFADCADGIATIHNLQAERIEMCQCGNRFAGSRAVRLRTRDRIAYAMLAAAAPPPKA